MVKIPIDFEEKVKLGADPNGYPYRISARDLMADFSYAALDVEDDWVEKISVGSHGGRKIKLPALPKGGGVYLLGCVNGKIDWIEAETCS
jgi:hypothetical protein